MPDRGILTNPEHRLDRLIFFFHSSVRSSKIEAIPHDLETVLAGMNFGVANSSLILSVGSMARYSLRELKLEFT